MKKDVIYIDIEDEITDIISKLKESTSKIVALVPPKRSTVLNSVVNLKLLQRSATDNKKRLVLITSERALVSLAGGLGFPVAKNLHTKPEVPVVDDAPEPDETIIEGEEIDLDPDASIGALAEKHQPKKIDVSDVNEDMPLVAEDATPTKKRSLRVPNFDAFRSKILLGGLVVLLLIGGWIWAFQIAPKASVKISAQTSRVDSEITLDVNNKLDETMLEENAIKPVIEKLTRKVSEQFDVTGEKDVGNKADGTMTIQNCGSSLPTEVEAGTTFTSSGGLDFVTDETVVVPGGVFTPTCTSPGEADVPVTAAQSGDSYNLAPTSYTTPEDGVDGFGGQMSGGTTEKVKVVSQGDFDSAKEDLRSRNFDELKKDLRDAFGDDVVVIEESFDAREGAFTTDPSVGSEAKKATATVEMTFSMMALNREELSQAIESDVNQRISTDQQSIYESGIDNVSFVINERKSSSRLDVTARSATFVGPEINTDTLAEDIAGKPFSEARAQVEALPGVRSVDIDFSPFWVSKAPRASKINVTIEIAETSLQ